MWGIRGRVATALMRVVSCVKRERSVDMFNEENWDV